MKPSLTSSYPPLSEITKPTVTTAEAAYYLNRSKHTLHIYALTGHPIRPIRFNGRLAWNVADIKKVLGVSV